MKYKSAIGVIAVLILIVGTSGCTDNQNSNNSTYQVSQQNNTTNNIQTPTAKISPEEAKKTAEKYIEQPGATAGEPVLINTDEKATYIVPIILKGNQVGEILINAQTGENIGGAGGVSDKP